MLFNGSRREWITHIGFLGKDASNLSFPVTAQCLIAACLPGMVFSSLAYTQPYANLLGSCVPSYSCASAGDLARGSAEYHAGNKSNGVFSCILREL